MTRQLPELVVERLLRRECVRFDDAELVAREIDMAGQYQWRMWKEEHAYIVEWQVPL